MKAGKEGPMKKNFPKSFENASPNKFSWSKALDNVSTGLTGLGMIPIVGNAADAANTALSAGRAGYAKYKGDDKAAKKHMADAAINAAAMVPGAGLAVGAGKLAEKVTKEGGKLAAKAGKKTVVGKTKEEVNKKIDKKPSKPSDKKITIKKDKPKKSNLA